MGGKAIKVSSVSRGVTNQIFFMDSPTGNGMDVLVTLDEKDMEIFRSDKVILEYASPVVKM